MPDPLRLMTFNVQLLPVIAGVAAGTVSLPGALVGLFPSSDSDAIARASAVAAELAAIPPLERPHVIGLNEVFSEDGRNVLLTQLEPLWPHVIESVHEGDLEEDAGLMVFSSLPFRVLPGGGNRLELFYSTDAGADSWSSKAAVLVQVDAPVEETTLVFTHLQASYLGEDQHRQVREQQLVELVHWVDAFFGNDPGKWRNLILAGDLNVRGDRGQSSGEWFDLFDMPGHPVGDRFQDSWIEMRPPNEPEDHDPGLTYRDRATGDRMRLDYLCRVRPVDAAQVVAHHMSIGHRNVSDHFALESLFQQRDPHCQPSAATDIDALGPVTGASGSNQPVTSMVFAVPMQITLPGAFHWIWIPRPGTYTFHTEPSLVFSVFADSDISRPLERIDTLSVDELPPELQQPYGELSRLIDRKGETFVSRTPLLIAVRHKHMQTATGFFFVLEHQGDSPATAIALPPHLNVDVPFPAHQRLGADDVAWFRVRPRATLMAKARPESITLSNPAGRSGTVEAVDRSLVTTTIPALTGTGNITLGFTATQVDDFFVKVARDGDDAVGHIVRWHTPVTYLHLDEVCTIHVTDETSADWPGADEPELVLGMDGEVLLSTSWDDADTGEDWPSLSDSVRAAAVKRGWTSSSIGFSDAIVLTIVEPDPPLGAAHGVTSHVINALSPNEPVGQRSTAITVFDTVSDGTYTFSCTLSRDP
jgi:hypothetical protein